MIPKESERNSRILSVTVKPRTLKALNEYTKKTGNRSFIVNLALEEYLGLEELSKEEEKKLKAS